MTDSPKPREWWIDGVGVCLDEEPQEKGWMHNCIHVIEYAAYEELRAEVERLSDDLHWLCTLITSRAGGGAFLETNEEQERFDEIRLRWSEG